MPIPSHRGDLNDKVAGFKPLDQTLFNNNRGPYQNRSGSLLEIFIYVPHGGHFLRVQVSM